MNRLMVWLPLGVFAILVGFFFKGLTLDPTEQPSALIGQPVPAFELTDLNTGQLLSRDMLPKEPFLLNVWASWCITCQVEHPYLTKLSEQMPVVGLNYKDTETAAKNWLQKLGDPYALQIFDPTGRLGLDLGVAGAPETFLVDANGVIQLRIQGEVNDRVFAQKIQPMLETIQ
ncbi:MAG: DsbE family thiol:disulfide interchange protein [Litorivicinaceae bacterium]|jgi:cytochrome c biogenesis protein CcmG/thiol:disulfide interchange protein DsbE|nr:DsbE family thiol:disulfide interchange protein [Gammaproteobacteria bacterium]NCX48189.1 DsbE family thiol:disulfide interchange protein [Gammaproteobacteria bacterium]